MTLAGMNAAEALSTAGGLLFIGGALLAPVSACLVLGNRYGYLGDGWLGAGILTALVGACMVLIGSTQIQH